MDIKPIRPRSVNLLLNFILLLLVIEGICLLLTFVYILMKRFDSIASQQLIISFSKSIFYIFIYFKIIAGRSWIKIICDFFLSVSAFYLFITLGSGDLFTQILSAVQIFCYVAILYLLYQKDTTFWFNFIDDNGKSANDVILANKPVQQEKPIHNKTANSLRNEQLELKKKLAQLEEKVSEKELLSKLENENIEMKRKIEELENKLTNNKE